MEGKREHIDNLIVIFLSEGLDKDSLKELKQWIAMSPENEKYFLQKQEVWFSAVNGTESDRYNKDKAFERFKQRMDSARQGRDETPQRQFQWSGLWRYAAVVAVLCVISYFSYWRGAVGVKNDFAEISVEAPLGSRTKLFLPDGTMVWLNAGSRMTYSQGFGVDERSVKLVGEGYFEVKRNEKLPFSVKTQDLQVRVLGTKFNFRDYPEDCEAVVSLLEGKVALDNLIRASNEMILNPNDRVVLNKKSGKMQLERSIATNAFQWTNGYLFFDEELLPDIVKELERSYNVKIRITNEALKTFRFYGNFVRREQSIKEVLEALAATGKIHYKIEECNVTLY